MSEKIICHGCGLEIQTNDENKPGYAPKEAVQRTSVLCRRCFRLQHYGEFKIAKLKNEKFLEILQSSNNEDSLVIYVIDIFNFYGSIIQDLPKIIKNPILIAINKIDLLPKSVKPERVIKWVKEKLDVLKVKYVDIEVISANKKINIDSLFDKIKKYSNQRSVYMIGNANVGKSSIINAILKSYSNPTNELISSSVFPGTTLKTIKIPFDDGCFLYDTPGLLDQASILNYLDEKNIRVVIPTKEIKPLSYQLFFPQSFFIGSLVRIDFKGDLGTTLILYGSDRLHISRHTILNFDGKIDARFDRLVEEKRLLPYANQRLSISAMEKRSFHFSQKDRKTIFINGLCFIDIISMNADLDIYVPKGVEVTIDTPMIGGKNHAHK